MSIKELERLRILQKAIEKELTQKEAADLLNLSDRQVRKLIKELKLEGIKALTSKREESRAIGKNTLNIKAAC